VLQIEYGYDGNFRGDQFRSQQAAPLTFRFAPVERVLLDFNFDTVISEKNKMRMRQIRDWLLLFMQNYQPGAAKNVSARVARIIASSFW